MNRGSFGLHACLAGRLIASITPLVIMASSDPPSQAAHADTDNAGADTGSAFFDSFFKGALDRAGMTTSDLRGAAASAASSRAANPDGTASKMLPTTIASDGHGLDCGRDPSPSAEDLAQAFANAAQTTDSAAEPSSSRSPSLAGRSSTSFSSADADGLRESAHDSSISQAHANAAARALLSRSSSAGAAGYGIHGLRGGGLGTPRGEKTYMGGGIGSGAASGTLTPVMDKDGLGWPGEYSSAIFVLHSLARRSALQLQARQSP